MRQVFAILALLIAVARPVTAQTTEHSVTIFAAASLQSALKNIADDWSRKTKTPVIFSFAASSTLARQIENGAPADIFASADLDWMDWVQQRNLIQTASRRNILGNSLVLIASLDTQNALKIAPGFPLATAIGGSKLAIGQPQSVPAGRYAQAALTSLGIWKDVSPLIAGADNVRVALTLVARGEARFGIVYRTDALSESRVRIVDTFPPVSHPSIVYPFALTKSASPAAAAFLSYLMGPEARRIFEVEGFSLLN